MQLKYANLKERSIEVTFCPFEGQCTRCPKFPTTKKKKLFIKISLYLGSVIKR